MFWIDLRSVDWNAVSAISTAAATATALLASWLALKAPQWSREAERAEAISEVLRAARDALGVYHAAAELVEQQVWPDDLATLIQIRSDHLYMTLDRLISRQSLSDGAITVGAGAMSVLKAIAEIPSTAEALASAKARAPHPGLAIRVDMIGRAKIVIESAADIVKVVEDRANKVEAYMKRRWWHRIKPNRKIGHQRPEKSDS